MNAIANASDVYSRIEAAVVSEIIIPMAATKEPKTGNAPGLGGMRDRDRPNIPTETPATEKASPRVDGILWALANAS